MGSVLRGQLGREPSNFSQETDSHQEKLLAKSGLWTLCDISIRQEILSGVGPCPINLDQSKLQIDQVVLPGV